jgi:hypothetical protein
MKMIQLDKFNDFVLVQLKHPHGSKMENDIEVIVLSKQRKVLSRDTLMGNRYWIGTTKITDWNNDGINELVYKYDAPVSSVPIMSKYEEVYGILKGKPKLKKIFELETEAFNCGPGDSSLITRTYSFEGKYKIKIKQVDFIVNCNSGKEENKKQEKRKIAESISYLKWNDSNNKYE